MRGRRSSWPSPALLIGAVALLAAVYPAIAIGNSSHATRGAAASVAPVVGAVTADAAKSLTPASAPKLPAAAPPAGAIIDRPSMPLADYLAAKAAADAAAKVKRGGGAAAQSNVSQDAVTKVASANTLLGSFNATGECGSTVNDGCWFPPDVNGAVGANQLVEIVNNHIDVYTKSTSPSVLMELTTNSFFGWPNALTDPRVEYDSLWGRWVAVEQDFANHMFLAISIDNNLTHGWFVYGFTVPATSEDYPQLALTQDAIVITYSDFAAPENARTFGVAKALAYNAFGFSVPVFTLGNNATATPSNVIDQNPVEHELLYMPGVGVNNVSFTDPQAGFFGAITANVATPVTALVPPSANQFVPSGCPVPSCNIDTLDGRFQNDQTQYGTHLWAVHTQPYLDVVGGLPTPQWYDINSSTSAITQSGFVFLTATTNDWNPSIASTTGDTVNINWSSVNNPLGCPPTNPICGANNFPGMVFTGRVAGDAANTMNAPVKIFSSPSALTGNYQGSFNLQRWGDTSSVRFDPAGNGTSWAFNETVQSGGNLWGTRGAQIKTN